MWVKVDDHFDQHPKLAKVGPLGLALWVSGLAYCNRNLTDGFIPWSTAQTLISWRFLEPDDKGEKVWETSATSGMGGLEPDEMTGFVVGLLCKAGLWEQVEGGYNVHDYLDYQPSREKVLGDRKKTAERVARHRDASSGRIGNGVTNALVTTAPYPVPVTEKKEPNTLVPGKREREPVGFAECYAIYPRRDGRRAAARAFKNALRRHPTYTPEDIAWAAGEYAKSRSGEDPQFTAMPATWLNQDRFREYFDEDENGTETKDQAIARIATD